LARDDEAADRYEERIRQLGCEIALDVGNHVLAGAFGGGRHCARRAPERFELFAEEIHRWLRTRPGVGS
jgi:hypothetical protein